MNYYKSNKNTNKKQTQKTLNANKKQTQKKKK